MAIRFIPREIQAKIASLVSQFPVVSVTGPRQSGKTTLLKNMFPGYRYESLEEPDTRMFAQSDPRRFLDSEGPMILDEIQRVPDLFSFIQARVDETGEAGRFIISGSQSFLLNQHIAQSLAGRVAVVQLLPLSMTETGLLQDKGIRPEDFIFRGFYPALYSRNIEPSDFYPSYVQTYVERDVRQLQNIHDLNLFIRFLKLCAGRIGQLLNVQSLASDCGTSPNTIKSWLSILEASYVIFFLRPYHLNFNKRLVKMPKLYFHDTGLASSLLEIHHVSQLNTHYLRGGLFENLILSELYKKRTNQGLRNNCWFWRDNKGMEVDCLLEGPDSLSAIEIKSGATYSESYFDNLKYWYKLTASKIPDGSVVYGGDITRETRFGTLLSWREMGAVTRDG